jgi:hypothetical protein
VARVEAHFGGFAEYSGEDREDEPVFQHSQGAGGFGRLRDRLALAVDLGELTLPLATDWAGGQSSASGDWPSGDSLTFRGVVVGVVIVSVLWQLAAGIVEHGTHHPGADIHQLLMSPLRGSPVSLPRPDD